MTFQNIAQKIVPVLQSEGVLKAAIFGSVARGETKKNSDVDLLVDLAEDKSLLDLAGLKVALEDLLKSKVDLVTYDAIYPPLKKNILKEQIIIYEKKA